MCVCVCVCVCARAQFRGGCGERGEKKILAEEGNQAFPLRPQGRHSDTRPPPSSPTRSLRPRLLPGQGKEKLKVASLNWSSVEKGKRVSSLGKWPSPGWPQAPGLLLRWKKKTCSNRSDALFSNPKYPVAAAGSATAGGKWGKRRG